MALLLEEHTNFAEVLSYENTKQTLIFCGNLVIVSVTIISKQKQIIIIIIIIINTNTKYFIRDVGENI